MSNFKKLLIWQKGIEIAVECYNLVSGFPKEEKFGISSQITKAGISIPSNIAEGSGRGGAKEFKRFLEIALGSAFELETQLIISKSVCFNEISCVEHLMAKVVEEQKMLTGFIGQLLIPGSSRNL